MIPEGNVGIAIFTDGHNIRIQYNATVEGLIELLRFSKDNVPEIKEAIERLTKTIEISQTFTKEGIKPFLDGIENCKELYVREAGTDQPFIKIQTADQLE